MHDSVSNGEKILVHCRAGRSRSVCIVAAYLVKHAGLTRTAALELMQSQRGIYLSPGIEEIFHIVRI
ncbi:MAG: dual specificity protein phosphatase [Thermodesulfobacteriota bacterium]